MEEYSRANVNRIKKFIIFSIVILILIPIVLCVVLFIRMNRLEKKLDQVLSEKETMLEAESIQQDVVLSSSEKAEEGKHVWKTTEREALPDKNETAKLDADAISSLEKDTTQDTGLLQQERVEATPANASVEYNGHKVYLTFDDGPSPYTDEILEILRDKGVKATFFVVTDDYTYADELRKIVEEGHTLALHSMSHIYSEIYADLDSFKADVDGLHDLLYDITGVDVRYYRFPGGSSNTVSAVSIRDCIDYLDSCGITYFDWNALNGDAEYTDYTPEELNQNVMGYVRNNPGNSTILLHDLDKHYSTVEALPELIDTLIEEGYEILPITDATTPVQHIEDEE